MVHKIISHKAHFYLLFVLIALQIVSCKKKEIKKISFETDSITDIDGNNYKTVKIGEQWWMTENLKTTKFKNGDPIRGAQYETQWIRKLPAYCKYDDKETGTGLLYNYYTLIDSNGLAPEGWHIATDNDLKKLEMYLGMTQKQADSISWRGNNEGEKIKAEGLTAWRKYEDIWNTNSSGFSALAGSCRLPDAAFGDPGLFNTGFWWCGTQNNEATAFYRHLDYKSKKIMRHYVSKNYGMSVRCVKD